MTRPMFDDSWKPQINVNELSHLAIDADKWDMEDIETARDEVAALRASRKQLEDFAGEPGPDAMDDTVLALLKSEPEVLPENEVRPDRLVNRVVADEMMKLDETEKLRRYSVNDLTQAALSAICLEPELEIIYDKLKQAQEKGKQLQGEIEDWQTCEGEVESIEGMIDRAKAGDMQGPGGQMTQEQIDEMLKKLEEVRKAAEEAKAKAEQTEQELQEELGNQQAGVKQALQKAVGEAAKEAQEAQEMGRAWGLDPGTLKKMDPTQRIELAKRLNNPKFKRIADLFGPMRNLLMSEQARKTTHVHEELFDVGIGSDLGRVLPQEVLNLREGPTRLDFLRRYSEGKLLQYELQGTEKLGRGGIVYCEDGSGSMSGDRTIWAKAVGLALIHLARDQKREIHIFHFSGPGSIQTFKFTKPEDFTIDNMLAYAEGFYGGGTDYVGPMKKAMQVLATEFNGTGKTKSDIVFATDDECHVSPDFMEQFLAEMKRVDGTVWGIAIGCTPAKGGALHKMTEGKVATVQSLMDGGDIRAVFRQVT